MGGYEAWIMASLTGKVQCTVYPEFVFQLRFDLPQSLPRDGYPGPSVTKLKDILNTLAWAT